MFLGEVLDCAALDIDRIKCLGILRFQAGGQATDARTDLGFELRMWLNAGFEFSDKRFEGTTCRTPPPKLIDSGVTQSSIEPGNNPFVTRHEFRTVDDLCKGILQDVLGQVAVTDLSSQKVEERAMVLQENIDELVFSDGLHLNKYRKSMECHFECTIGKSQPVFNFFQQC